MQRRRPSSRRSAACRRRSSTCRTSLAIWRRRERGATSASSTPSRMGKSQYAMSLFGREATIEVNAADEEQPSLQHSDSRKLKLIRLDEACPEKVPKNRKVFQAPNAVIKLGQSETNPLCYQCYLNNALRAIASNGSDATSVGGDALELLSHCLSQSPAKGCRVGAAGAVGLLELNGLQWGLVEAIQGCGDRPACGLLVSPGSAFLYSPSAQERRLSLSRSIGTSWARSLYLGNKPHLAFFGLPVSLPQAFPPAPCKCQPWKQRRVFPTDRRADPWSDSMTGRRHTHITDSFRTRAIILLFHASIM